MSFLLPRHIFPLVREWNMGGLVYGGKFEQHINELYSPKNIKTTAKKFKEWEKHSGGIPAPIRNRLSRVISKNLRSAKPKPMVLKVGENVDASHDLHVKTFKHKGHEHIGLHMLCPNTSLKK